MNGRPVRYLGVIAGWPPSHLKQSPPVPALKLTGTIQRKPHLQALPVSQNLQVVPTIAHIRKLPAAQKQTGVVQRSPDVQLLPSKISLPAVPPTALIQKVPPIREQVVPITHHALPLPVLFPFRTQIRAPVPASLRLNSPNFNDSFRHRIQPKFIQLAAPVSTDKVPAKASKLNASAAEFIPSAVPASAPLPQPPAISIAPTALLHFDEIVDRMALPPDEDELRAFISRNLQRFQSHDAQSEIFYLGNYKTWVFNNHGNGIWEALLRPWSIMRDKVSGKIFHYGPTGWRRS